MSPDIQAAVEFVERRAGSGRLCAGQRVWLRRWRGEGDCGCRVIGGAVNPGYVYTGCPSIQFR